MKKILITGKNGYIGGEFVAWLTHSTNNYQIEMISVRDNSWKDVDFSTYDTVLHLAGIAHVSRNPKMEELYYTINRDLTFELAKKSKLEGVSQFIFMSSIIVYGESTKASQVINQNTLPKPSNFYGNSKFQAENKIKDLEDTDFNIVIIRPPMIYGKNSKGNYPKLSKVARKTPFFPSIKNQRSMLHIDNLCEFIKLMIDNKESGLFFPQNQEYTETSEMVRMIGEVHGNNIRLIRMFNPLIVFFIERIDFLNKMFGNLVYDKELSSYKDVYQIRNFKESIYLTERGENIDKEKSPNFSKS
ncbi:NAD-dependent epimerase/dehydratase family protein [Psychrobacillus sp. MER TA 171]|uniref:NAD-dependent epimerase/dehydratase family protein n=1 Tax=Psychrobacillus sp. MER TA 171 TaxID=2939577 RepID=UPI00203B22A4|nr:NAD-dependent epimerase/dehydratase family protein [Psychrobacillus sp. MER TA 171]MCM3356557.1 NAD-dependent epimerase/dehydratase family protein [Psychrobacillus sp. MER TA 171]